MPPSTAVIGSKRHKARAMPEINQVAQQSRYDPAMSLNDDLPAALRSVRTQPMFVMRLQVKPMEIAGATPGGFRRFGIITSGTFEGERLSGTVLDGGSDWQIVRGDGLVTLEVRVILKTNNGALIGMTYRGFRFGPAQVMARLDKGEAVDPADYYFRTNPLFETAAPQYDWINRIVAVGIGHRRADDPGYSIFEML